MLLKIYMFHDRVSLEELFIELAVNNVDTVAADRLAIITGLDVNTLYEVLDFDVKTRNVQCDFTRCIPIYILVYCCGSRLQILRLRIRRLNFARYLD